MLFESLLVSKLHGSICANSRLSLGVVPCSQTSEATIQNTNAPSRIPLVYHPCSAVRLEHNDSVHLQDFCRGCQIDDGVELFVDARQYDRKQNIKDLFSEPLQWSQDETWLALKAEFEVWICSVQAPSM